VPDPYPYYALYDVFALTSREEPFSVSMLEAAQCGLPIVCFADAGGAPDLVGDDAGVIVPYLDIDAMARACLELIGNKGLSERLGATAKEKVETQFTLAKQGPKLLGAITSLINTP
jgi:glycosyltransferase involved in cell wall biosynthesis